MMKEVRHGIAIGIVCVFIVAGIGSFIAQALMSGHEASAEHAPAAEQVEEAAPAAE